MSEPHTLLAAAGVPAFTCPPGTKVHFLNLGILRADEGWFLQGGNTATASNPNPEHKWRELICLAILIDHPQAGLLLFETGCAEDIDVVRLAPSVTDSLEFSGLLAIQCLQNMLTSYDLKKWGAPLVDVFPRATYNEEHKLPNAIKAAGYDIKDVKGVILGHLHLDHAGGLEHFLGTDIPIYVHEEEFKHACWAAGTGADSAVYLTDYLSLDKLNWRTFSDSNVELFQGIDLILGPGHTPGLCMMMVRLEKDGNFLFTTDHFHVKENHEQRHPQGWLARDHTAWVRTSQLVDRLTRIYNAKVVYGHDLEVARKYIDAQEYYT